MFRTALRRTTPSAFTRPTTQVNRLPSSLIRRGYADAPAKSENLKLSLSVPHRSIFSNKEVYFPYFLMSIDAKGHK